MIETITDIIMTKDDFLQLQELQRESGVPLMKYLKQIGLNYSTYTYWKRKFRSLESEESNVPFAQITLQPDTTVALPTCIGHITLRFPNGVHVCLDAGMEESASRLITSYPYCHVLPE